jgi:His/Glu/Gln/Arg/opine family amino acid ABC transporter permease subunit
MGDSIVKFLETWSPIDIVLIAQNFDRFLWGALTTLELTIISLIVGGILSIPLAIIRAGNNPFLNAPVWVFTYVFRGTPLLVQTYLIYYGLGQFEWIRETFLWGPILSQAWYCALIAFSLNTAPGPVRVDPRNIPVGADPVASLVLCADRVFTQHRGLYHRIAEGFDR